MSASVFFDDGLVARAEALVQLYRGLGFEARDGRILTGGLIAALLTEIPGSSAVLDRGFVTYSNQAKQDSIGVAETLLAAHGAVSAPVARAMAEGALRASQAHVAVAVTGIAGPDGGSPDKPVGLVFVGCASRGGQTLVQEHRFGDLGRGGVRRATVLAAFDLIEAQAR